MDSPRTALITGSSRGLGRALAGRLAEQGWRLLLTGRTADDLALAAAELARTTEVVARAGDVADAAHRDDVLGAVDGWGRLDLLVNNASTLGPTPLRRLADLTPEALTRILECGRLDAAFVNGPDEDVHSFVERMLVERLGDAGRRLHTGRSRNEQVSLDLRLYLRRRIPMLQQAVRALVAALRDQARAAGNALMPAFTADLFGLRAMSAVLGVLYTSVAFGTLLGPTLAGWVFDSTGSYLWPILICAVGCVVSALMVWKLPRS